MAKAREIEEARRIEEARKAREEEKRRQVCKIFNSTIRAAVFILIYTR